MIQEWKEVSVYGKVASRRPEFQRLGLSDAALIEIAGANMILLTNDTDLFISALSTGKQAVHFEHLRNGSTFYF